MDRRQVIVTIEEETRTLVSGKTFVRRRCPVCRSSWDVQHSWPGREPEDEIHNAGCPVAGTIPLEGCQS